jgi:GNAT superfamily N-acetyltransferase
MYSINRYSTDEEWARLVASPAPARLPELKLERQKANAHLTVNDGAGEVTARCSLWWDDTPPYDGQRLGLAGHYAARDAGAAGELLRAACAELKDQGCTVAVGPMDGNTWRRYRLLTERGAEPAFFLEPDNPDEWPGHFTGNGFEPLAHYFSALTTDLARRDGRMGRVAARMDELGVVIRPLRADDFAGELARIYDVSEESFARNFLYTPVSREEFVAQYLPVRPFIQASLVFIAEQGERPIGFSFSLPDLLQARRGQAVDTVIVKTIAVRPEKSHAGLGSLLVARTHEAAARLGFRRAIHALMHESNSSLNISRHYAEPMRHYTLYAKAL